jgi:nucleoside-diphosphate-sugar epimerase
MISKKILIFGGSGYVGSKLIFNLLQNKFQIINYDLNLYGKKHLPYKNNKFTQVTGDIRDFNKICKVLKKHNPDTIIHLACISNDPSFLLNKELSKEVNYDSFVGLMKILERIKIEKFIFASTCSVYGVSNKAKVIETHPLKPITLYNKYKADSEKEFLKRIKKKFFEGIIIRPATVCGVSPKMRFDLTVNILTNFAYKKNYIKVFGGSQSRPNIHIDDIVRLYKKLCKMSLGKHNGQIFNAGFENYSINQIALKVKTIVKKITKKNIQIRKEASDDLRSYNVNSDKIKKILKFKPQKTINNAIKEIVVEFEKGRLKDSFSNLNYFNVKKLKKTNLK